ncbi:hypothetical protein BVY03_01070, partial [bacterium K02(2017)]
GNALVATATSTVDNTSEFSTSVNTITSINPYVVTSPDTTGEGSLRWTINNANMAGGNVAISFDITSCYGTFCSIDLNAALPSITTSGVTINGYTQNGASVNTASYPSAFNGSINIIVDGTGAGSVDGLTIDGANNTTIKGLAINNFDGDGVLVTGSGTGNKIQGSYIGVWFDGTSDAGNTGSGVYVNLTSETIIGSNGDGTGEAWERNLIAANDSYGVYVSGTTTSISGNFVGVTYEGSVALGNTTGGIFINSSYAQIGTDNDGTDDTTEGNIISGNTGTGIYVTGTGATANTIAGNYIGVGQDGSLDLGNGTHGVWLLSSASDNTIGGVDNDTVNVIAYNGDAASEYGIYLSGADTDNNKIY